MITDRKKDGRIGWRKAGWRNENRNDMHGGEEVKKRERKREKQK